MGSERIQRSSSSEIFIPFTRIVRHLTQVPSALERIGGERQIAGVGFDLFGTLVDSQIPWEVGYGALAQRGVLELGKAGVVIDAETWRKRDKAARTEDRRLRNHFMREVPLTETYARIIASVLSDTAQQLGEEVQSALIDRMSRMEMSFLLESTVVKDGAIEMLEMLDRKGLPLGIFSNTPTDRDVVRAIARKTGLTEFIPEDAILTSSQDGIAKPDPRTIDRLAGSMGVANERLVFVGDRLNDVLAADSVGAVPLLLLS